MILSDYELACLYSANGDGRKLDELLTENLVKLADMSLVKIDPNVGSPGYVITDAGKRFLAEHMNNRGIA